MPFWDIALLLYPMTSSCGDPVSSSFKLVYNFFNQNWWCNDFRAILQGSKNLVHAGIVHHTCTKHPFKVHEMFCMKIKYTAIKTFWI